MKSSEGLDCISFTSCKILLTAEFFILYLSSAMATIRFPAVRAARSHLADVRVSTHDRYQIKQGEGDEDLYGQRWKPEFRHHDLGY